MKKTLIIGCGELGIPLGLKLAENGHQVTGIRRQIQKLPQGIQGVAIDLAQELPTPEWLSQFSLIYIILTPSERSESAYHEIYGSIIPQLNQLISQTQAFQRVILTSSSHVYAEDSGKEVDENTSVKGYDYRSVSLIAAEESLFKLNASPLHKEGICVRFSGLYTEKSQYAFKQISSGQPITNPEHYMNFLHREDAVGFLFYLSQIEKNRPLYLASDDCPVKRKVFFKTIAQYLSKEILFAESTHAGGKQCSNKRLKDSGYQLNYPDYVSGYQLST